MAFTPKFVDLVRNITATVGTGPITLGAAVDGYLGFAEACTAGDQFYYCIQGIDRPTEREVGRGTMQANGTIVRDAIGGTATNFKSGNKTIALVAAAEWYQQAGSQGQEKDRASLAARANRTAPVMLTEKGRSGLFRFDGSNQAAKVTADTAQGMTIAPTSDATGASGAWVRQADGEVNVRWFGAVGDDVTNDGPAFLAAIACLKSMAQSGPYSSASPTLFVPAGKYFLGGNTLDVAHTLRIRGEGTGEAGGNASQLRWTNGTTGIRLQSPTTSGAASIDATQHSSAAATIIEGLMLVGGYAGGAEGEFHGLHAKTRFIVRDSYICNFAGDGVHAHCTGGAGAPDEGNCNNSYIEKLWVDSCRNGVSFQGGDANACTIIGLNTNYNRRFGVRETGFLGNNYLGAHGSGNGVTGLAGIPVCACHSNGKLYYVRAGQAAGASTNAPSGTKSDNAWWGYWRDGTASSWSPDWASGIVVREGGAYWTDNFNAANRFDGCYSEGDQPPSQMIYPTLVTGGMHAAGISGSAAFISSYQNFCRINGPAMMGKAGSHPNSLRGDARIGRLDAAEDGIGDVELNLDQTNYYATVNFRAAGGATTYGYIRAGYTTKLSYGHDGRHCFEVAGTQIAEINASGLLVNNPAKALGYGAGWTGSPGGSVTQATSKATAVTLNRPCGQIVLNAAALAAGASVSFTLNNNLLAASDVVSVAIGAGASAGAYVAAVDQVAASSCRISLRNQSAASLSEAVSLNFAIIKAVAA